MSDCMEVLYASESSGSFQTVSCFDPHIGTTLMNYKGGGSVPKNGLALIGNDYLITSESKKPLLHVWPLNSQDSGANKRVVAGTVTALCVSPDGHFCVAGINGKIYIWSISSGSLLNVITKHYQDITKIRFSADSTYFITGGEDGIVLVWRLADTIAQQAGNSFNLTSSNNNPIYKFNHHSLPVTDLFIGHGGRIAHLFTVSIDHTCKIYSLVDGSVILSIAFQEILRSVVTNTLETKLFVGTDSGAINSFSLDPLPRTLNHVAEDSSNNCLIGHKKAVTCLSVSIDGRSLASGSDDEKVILWDIPTKQPLRTFEMKGPVTNILFSLASRNIFSNEFQPKLLVGHFERVSNLEKSPSEINIVVTADVIQISHQDDNTVIDVGNSFLNDRDALVNLKEEIARLKMVNADLYEFAMGQVLADAGIYQKKEPTRAKRRKPIL